MYQDNGEVVRSVEVEAERFIIDSRDKIFLINNATREINCFNANGIRLGQIPIDNFTGGLKLALTKEDETVFNSDKLIYF